MYLLVLPGKQGIEFGLTPIRVCKALSDEEAKAVEARRPSVPDLAASDPAQAEEWSHFVEMLQAVQELVDEPARQFAYALIDHFMADASQRAVRKKLCCSLLAKHFKPGCAPPGISWRMYRWQSEMTLHFVPSMLVVPVARSLACAGWLQMNRVGTAPADLLQAMEGLKREIECAPDDPQVLAELGKRLAHHAMVHEIMSMSRSSDGIVHARIFMDLSSIVPAQEHASFIDDFTHLASKPFMGEWLCRVSQRIVQDSPRAMISVAGGLGLAAALQALARRPTRASEALRELDLALNKANMSAHEAWRSACQASRDLVMKGGHMGRGFTSLARLAIAREKGFEPPFDPAWVREADSLRYRASECVWLARWSRWQNPEDQASLVSQWVRWIEGDDPGKYGVAAPKVGARARRQHRLARDASAPECETAQPDEALQIEAPPPSITTEDTLAERRLQVDVLQAAASYFVGEIDDLAAKLHLLDSAESQQQTGQAWRARLSTWMSDGDLEHLDLHEAFEVLAQAEAWVTQVHESLRRGASQVRHQQAFEQALLHALGRERFIFEGHRAGGAVGMAVHPADWQGIHATYHGRRVLGLGLRFDEVQMDLQPDEALVLYVTATSRSGYLFDVSLHLWRRRPLNPSSSEGEGVIEPQRSTSTSHCDAPARDARSPGRDGRRGRGGRQPRGRGAHASPGTARRIRIEAESIDRGLWYDTRSTVLVLHVPQLALPQGRLRRTKQRP